MYCRISVSLITVTIEDEIDFSLLNNDEIMMKIEM